MLSQQNSVIKQQIKSEMPQFQSRDSMIKYYVNYEFPQKQKAVKDWWQDLIQKIIKKKNQIFIQFQDLQNITTIHGMKPIPLKNVLIQLKKQFVFIKEQDITQEKPPQKRVKPWYTNVISFAWSTTQKQLDYQFKFQPKQKVVSQKGKERKRKQLLNYFHQKFNHEHSKFIRNVLRDMSMHLKVDQISVDLLLKQLKRQNDIAICEIQTMGDQIIIYHSQRKKLQDQNFIKVQKMKSLLRSQLQKLEHFYQKSSQKIFSYRTKAKDALTKNDKLKGKQIIAQITIQNNHRQKINVRLKILQQKISQLQLNEFNKTSIDLLQIAQNVYKEVAIDNQKFQDVMEKQKQMQMNMHQNNKKLEDLVDSDELNKQVEAMMKEIEEESNTHSVPKSVKKKQKIEQEQMQMSPSENNEEELQADKQLYYNHSQ